MTKKQAIRLNESQLRRIIKESVKRVLNESDTVPRSEYGYLSDVLNSIAREYKVQIGVLTRDFDPDVPKNLNMYRARLPYYMLEYVPDEYKRQGISIPHEILRDIRDAIKSGDVDLTIEGQPIFRVDYQGDIDGYDFLFYTKKRQDRF